MHCYATKDQHEAHLDSQRLALPAVARQNLCLKVARDPIYLNLRNLKFDLNPDYLGLQEKPRH